MPPVYLTTSIRPRPGGDSSAQRLYAPPFRTIQTHDSSCAALSDWMQADGFRARGSGQGSSRQAPTPLHSNTGAGWCSPRGTRALQAGATAVPLTGILQPNEARQASGGAPSGRQSGLGTATTRSVVDYRVPRRSCGWRLASALTHRGGMSNLSSLPSDVQQCGRWLSGYLSSARSRLTPPILRFKPCPNVSAGDRVRTVPPASRQRYGYLYEMKFVLTPCHR